MLSVRRRSRLFAATYLCQDPCSGAGRAADYLSSGHACGWRGFGWYARMTCSRSGSMSAKTISMAGWSGMRARNLPAAICPPSWASAEAHRRSCLRCRPPSATRCCSPSPRPWLPPLPETGDPRNQAQGHTDPHRPDVPLAAARRLLLAQTANHTSSRTSLLSPTRPRPRPCAPPSNRQEPASRRRYTWSASAIPKPRPLAWSSPKRRSPASPRFCPSASPPATMKPMPPATPYGPRRPRATIGHFACHGQFNAAAPLDSALLLANGSQSTVRDLIHAESERLAHLRLVVLSACQTAITDFGNLPDEAVGLPSSFLQAGVPAVIGTLWPVNDISTALLMVCFYRYHLQDGLDPVTALHQAQAWLRDSTAAEMSLADWYQRHFEASGRKDRDAFVAMRYYRANPSVSSRSLIPITGQHLSSRSLSLCNRRLSFLNRSSPGCHREQSAPNRIGGCTPGKASKEEGRSFTHVLNRKHTGRTTRSFTHVLNRKHTGRTPAQGV